MKSIRVELALVFLLLGMVAAMGYPSFDRVREYYVNKSLVVQPVYKDLEIAIKEVRKVGAKAPFRLPFTVDGEVFTYELVEQDGKVLEYLHQGTTRFLVTTAK